MNIRFWGVRGSLATPLTNAGLISKIKTVLKTAVKEGLNDEEEIPHFIRRLPRDILLTAGGNTTCVEVQAGGKEFILDGGTGIRPLGLNLLKEAAGKPLEIHLFMSHTHWDHICGIPFFVPGFNPNNKIIVYGPHDDLEDRIRNQQKFEYFPVPLPPAFQFVHINEDDQFKIGDVEIKTAPLNHPGGSYGYRITYQGKSVVYATDSEYKEVSADALKPFTDFFHGADALIYDAQYTMVENIEKENWGHSNIFTGIDLALEADVKRLIFTHHEPTYDDKKLWGFLQKGREYLEINRSGKNLKVYLAFEGAYLNL